MQAGAGKVITLGKLRAWIEAPPAHQLACQAVTTKIQARSRGHSVETSAHIRTRLPREQCHPPTGQIAHDHQVWPIGPNGSRQSTRCPVAPTGQSASFRAPCPALPAAYKRKASRPRLTVHQTIQAHALICPRQCVQWSATGPAALSVSRQDQPSLFPEITKAQLKRLATGFHRIVDRTCLILTNTQIADLEHGNEFLILWRQIRRQHQIQRIIMLAKPQ